VEIYGYCGKILYVDLTTGEIRTKELDMAIAKKFIGDFGFNVQLGYELIKSGIDAFSPENVIIIGAGPLVGTRVQAPRCTILTKAPLTGAIAITSGGMSLATM
jgi:aldehyde:ferredoxin oxidoreductase